MRHLEGAIAAQARTVPQNIVYLHPTISKLATFLASTTAQSDATPVDATAAMERAVEEAIKGLTKRATPIITAEKTVVLLTGTTGTLGSYLLAALAKDDRVWHIYALNRPSKEASMEERQAAAFEDRGIDVGLVKSGKITLLEGLSSAVNLGLDESVFQEVRFPP